MVKYALINLIMLLFVSNVQAGSTWSPLFGIDFVIKNTWDSIINISCLEKGKVCGYAGPTNRDKVDLIFIEENSENYIFFGSLLRERCETHLRRDGRSYKVICDGKETDEEILRGSPLYDGKPIFEWAEFAYPHYFPSTGGGTDTITTTDGQFYFYRYYPQTNNYLGINGAQEFYVLGDVFGGLVKAEMVLPKLMSNEETTESFTLQSEKSLTIKINVPFEIDWGWEKSKIVKKFKHYRQTHYTPPPINEETNEVSYYAPNSFFKGEDFITLKLYDKNNKDRFVYKTYKFNVVNQSLEGHRDFTISYTCDSTSNTFSPKGSATSFDLNIVDDNLNIIEKVYDDHSISLSGDHIPRYTRIEIETDNSAKKDKKSIRHHEIFKRNTNHNILITCNYPEGYADLFFPIKKRTEWQATKETFSSKYSYAENTLFFYVSPLSDLHSKIYLRIVKSGVGSEEALNKANAFMDNTFPSSIYGAISSGDYMDDPNYFPYDFRHTMSGTFDKYNEGHLSRINDIADELTGGNVTKLLILIADNYESFYLSGNSYCSNNTICGLYFPESATSVTHNPQFSLGKEGWTENISYYNVGTGKSLWDRNNGFISLELVSNSPSNSGDPASAIDFYQTKSLSDGSSIDDYFFRFDLSHVFGGTSAILGGYGNSGVAGAYLCFSNVFGEQMGCLTWTDHTNKFDMAWGPTRNVLESSYTLFNTRFYNVVRRTDNLDQKHILHTVGLGNFTKNNLPQVYQNKENINSIEYGVFVTEFRNYYGCYFCYAKVKVHEINLLKKIQ